jgi:3-methyladenine DNA glycosylase/8-oxoguanine DNA glycosylase
MTDRNELQALQAAFRGALATSASLDALTERIDALDSDHALSDDEFEALARTTLAHAVSSQALRALVERMRSRRVSGG